MCFAVTRRKLAVGHICFELVVCANDHSSYSHRVASYTSLSSRQRRIRRFNNSLVARQRDTYTYRSSRFCARLQRLVFSVPSSRSYTS